MTANRLTELDVVTTRIRYRMNVVVVILKRARLSSSFLDFSFIIESWELRAK